MFLPGKEIGWKRFGKALGKEWKRDNLTNAAAGLVFWGLLAIFPFLLFLVTLAGLIIKPEQIDQLIAQLGQFAPHDMVQIVSDEIRDIRKSGGAGLLTVGFLGALWSASGGVTSLMSALDSVYAVNEGRPFWKVRLVAIFTTVLAALAILVAALAGVVAGPVAAHLPEPLSTVVTWLRLPVAGLVMMLLWACLYYFLPDVEQRFKFITPGSVLGVVVWVAASWGFSFYVSHFGSYNKTYGAIGGVVVMLMWMWISTLVLLLGAVVNATIEQLSPDGKRTGAKSMADKGADKPKAEKQDTGELGPNNEPATPPNGKPFVPVPAVKIVKPPARPRANAKPPGLLAAALGVALVVLFGRHRRTA